jgi:7,8-dihydropterin-6-yl-methyl-4-(beta-D-ribofuranosyl)aminobenzene 5'-phosphate synthase
MKLTVLVDNNTLIDRYFCGEPGVSYLIECEEAKILFDLGYSDLFIRNARSMGFDLLDVDFVVLSHGHLDHSWGLDPLLRMHAEANFEGRDQKRPALVAHPHALLPRFVEGIGPIGVSIDPEQLEGIIDVHLSAEPVWLTERLVFLGQIPVANDFEMRPAIGKLALADGLTDDRILDDSAIVYCGRDGLVIVTGCSHSGICNIIEKAMRVCNDSRVVDVIGGLHLMNPPENQIRRTTEYLGRLRLQALHACHCTDLSSKIRLSEAAALKEVGVGLMLDYE